MAKKDTTSNWWKQVIQRRKGQGADGESVAVEPSGEGPSKPGSQIVSPTPAPEQEPTSLEEQIDVVSGAGPEKKEASPLPESDVGRGPETVPEPPVVSPESAAPVTAAAGNRLPQELLAVLILIDIGGEMRQARQIPQYFQIQRVRTLVGRHAKAHIHLDDAATVRPEHARLFFQEKDGSMFFTIHPFSAGTVTVNETPVTEKGVVLKSGDLVACGSAKLVFFLKNLRGEDL